jgi:hypothetical protein
LLLSYQLARFARFIRFVAAAAAIYLHSRAEVKQIANFISINFFLF